MPEAPQKRARVTLETKGRILEDIANNMTEADISKKYGVSKGVINRAKQGKNKINAALSQSNAGEKSRLSQGRFQEIDEKVIEFHLELYNKGYAVTGTMLQTAGKRWAQKMGVENFQASTGWLRHLKSRNALIGKALCGEEKGVDEEVSIVYRQELPELLKGFAPANVFNCDETGLYFRATGTRGLGFKGERSYGRKVAKDRVTLLVAGNALGDMLPLMMIGKNKEPRALKGKIGKLPLTYAQSHKAWMTTPLFTEWLTRLDMSMKKGKRHILLFLDNAPVHVRAWKDLDNGKKLSHITLCFLPKNTTSKLQPADAGWIQGIKLNYRRLLNELLVNVMIPILDGETPADLNKEDPLKKINLLMVTNLLNRAVKCVTKRCISRCFTRCGFIFGGEHGGAGSMLNEEALSVIGENPVIGGISSRNRSAPYIGVLRTHLIKK